MDYYRVRIGNDHDRKCILIEVWDEEYQQYNIDSVFPIENFNKNEDLCQILVNKFYAIQNLGKHVIHFQYKEVEED